MNQLTEMLLSYGMNEDTVHMWAQVLMFVGMVIISVIANFITKRIALKILTHYITNNKYTWDNKMLENKVFQRLSHIVPALIIYGFSNLFTRFGDLLAKLATLYMVFVTVYVFSALLNAVDDIYKSYEVSKSRPIKSYLQVLKIFVFVMAGIVFVSTLIGRNPIYLLGGIGAMTAVLLLIFQDSILGLVAGIQLSANDMVRIGDWIEMPKYGADGDVIDITLNTVKVENFDRTITTIPTYALISDSFKNWRGISECGGRRIKRSISIDLSTIKFCTDEMLERFKEVHYIKDYIEEKCVELNTYNASIGAVEGSIVNGRHLTNIGIFRAYAQKYLENHPKTHKEMIVMVRQLPQADNGLPLEIYLFTPDIEWAKYEGVQADLFDHLLSIVPEFDLKVYQKPSGYDVKALGGKV